MTEEIPIRISNYRDPIYVEFDMSTGEIKRLDVYVDCLQEFVCVDIERFEKEHLKDYTTVVEGIVEYLDRGIWEARAEGQMDEDWNERHFS